MSLARGPEDMVCSARECENPATCAIIWSNPKIHTGRHKTWLACQDHRQFLVDYVGYRGFPVEVISLEELAELAEREGEHRGEAD